jgi:hypothetical protein
MATEQTKSASSKFPLRLMPSVRKDAEVFSEKEGVSLNQFINVAVVEKLAHLQHQAWANNRKQPTDALAARALALLDKAGRKPAEKGDELPKGYRSSRRRAL